MLAIKQVCEVRVLLRIFCLYFGNGFLRLYLGHVVIRGLALGTLNEQTQGQFLSRELKMAGSLSTILAFAGFARAIAFKTPFAETVAVTCALALIVFMSICLGAVLPLFLKKLGIDPAHSSTTIQVSETTLGVTDNDETIIRACSHA